MFENFKNLFNSKDTQEEELFPYDDAFETNITPEMFDEDIIRISAYDKVRAVDTKSPNQ